MNSHKEPSATEKATLNGKRHHKFASRSSLEEIALLLGGEVRGDQVSAPGPGHSPKDRSLCLKLDEDSPDGFVVHSFSSDDPIRCKDYVREKLGWSCWSGCGVPQHKAMVAEYDYVDEAGELLFQRFVSFPRTFVSDGLTEEAAGFGRSGKSVAFFIACPKLLRRSPLTGRSS